MPTDASALSGTVVTFLYTLAGSATPFTPSAAVPLPEPPELTLMTMNTTTMTMTTTTAPPARKTFRRSSALRAAACCSAIRCLAVCALFRVPLPMSGISPLFSWRSPAPRCTPAPAGRRNQTLAMRIAGMS